MVKRSRRQSGEAPRRRSWRVIVPPDSAFHSQTRSMNASRPSSCASICSLGELALDHHLRWRCRHGRCRAATARRARACAEADEDVLQVKVSAWPICRLPVTLGGGIMIV